MNLFKSKPKIKEQPPWVITSYSSIQNKGTDEEFDDGYIEFENGNLNIKKEMAELRGEKPYDEDDYTPPGLLDIWNMFLKRTPGTKGFQYKDWRIVREENCFVYVLIGKSCGEQIRKYKNIIRDYTSRQQDFSSFLNMLDKIQEEKDKTIDLGTI